MTFEQLCSVVEVIEVVGSTNSEITGLNRIHRAKAGEITFLDDAKYEKYLPLTQSSFILIKDSYDVKPENNRVYLKVASPYKEFLKLVDVFNDISEFPPGIHPTAVIESSATIHPSAFIGANCFVGANSKIGEGTVVYPNVLILENCIIGANSLIYPNVSIYKNTHIGNNCIIHSGAVIGSDGFGFTEHKDGSFTKIPQIGNVQIGNDVEIGSNTTIDRAFVGSTIIADGVKLDNLIQIAHNDEIGEHTAMAAQVGVSGSVIIGKRNRYGGQVGIAGHIEIADDVVLLAKSGVPKSMDEKGVYIGAPARDRLTAFKIEAVIHNLPALAKDISKIKKILGIDE